MVRLSAVRTGLLYPRGDTELSNVFFLEQRTIRNRYYLNIEMEIWGICSLGDTCKSYGLDPLIVSRM
jgi:hypothetical protein